MSDDRADFLTLKAMVGDRPWAVGPLLKVAERLLGLTSVAEIYRRTPPDLDVDGFLAAVLESADVRLEVAERDIERIPEQGSLVVVANHPFGGIEGVALAHLLRQRRPDVKVMANYILGGIPELRELFFLVDPFDGPGAVRRNLAVLRQTVRWVSDGGALLVFPAGEVASLDLGQRKVVDPPWDPTIGRLIRRAKCPVLPVRFKGHNGAVFQLLGLIHPRVRTMLLARELCNRRGSVIEANIGRPVSSKSLVSWPNDEGLISYLRMRIEVLAERAPGAPDMPASAAIGADATGIMPVVEPVPTEELVAELTSLDANALLVEGRDQQVFLAAADRIPAILREIGRLREVTFRQSGEGTGKELDLDRFDSRYLHLFVWSKKNTEIVGAYRLGQSDLLLNESGLDGLYTSSLFAYDRRLFDAMGPSLEMGRSFIRHEYQRSYTGLMLLWKGIGEYVRRHPQAATLFGPVSISADYLNVSQQLMVSFLKANSYGHEWAQWVRPRVPFQTKKRRNYLPNAADLRSIEEVSEFVSEIEGDGKGMPILLRQYLKLGGRLLGFNVDPAFSNVLDILVMVDLRKTDLTILGRYMGRSGAEEFLAHHK